MCEEGEKMSYILCMTEKPSVARDISNVICGKNIKTCDGFIEGNGYRVTWAVGHLVGLAEPETYGYVPQKDMYRERKEEALSQLPLLPEEFQLVVLENTKKQFAIVKKLINDPECESIINCGDMGPEGHILQWFIRVKAGCKKTVRRFCATSMTDEAIKFAFEHLRSEEEFESIIRGEFSKKKADWMMGISISRQLSLKYNANITVGRVQSPTLFFVYQRWNELNKFKPSNYFTLKSSLAEGFDAFFKKDENNKFPESVKDSSGRILNESIMDKICLKIQQDALGTIKKIDKNAKSIERPQLYDITELQRDANQIYGYTAAQTLDNAQCLYENYRVLTYPRTDSRFITTDLVPYMEERIQMIGSVVNQNIPVYDADAKKLLNKGLNLDHRIVNDSEVTDHHALLVTEKIQDFDLGSLVPIDKDAVKKGITSESLKNILDLVIKRMMVAFSEKYIYEQTDIEILSKCGISFIAKGKKPIQLGWKAFDVAEKTDEEDESEEQIFPDLQEGQIVHFAKCQKELKQTTPPKLHTEATLLTAMQNAGNSLGADGIILKGKGIGTQATRAQIIKDLFDKEYIATQKKGKTNYIIPTQKGLAVLRVTPRDLLMPKITADWENKIDLIAKNKMTDSQFMEEFKVFIKEKTEEIFSADIDIGNAFSSEKIPEGDCPWCGKPVYRFKNRETSSLSFYCSDKCGWKISDDNPIILQWVKAKLSESNMRKLMNKGFVIVECTSLYNEKKIKRKLEIQRLLKDGKIYAKLCFSAI